MTAAQLATLKTELNTDPQAIGYATFFTNGNIGAVEAQINLVRAGAPYVVFRSDVAPKEIVAAIAAADFTLMSPAIVEKLQFLFTGNIFDATNSNSRANLTGIVSAATQPTKDAVLAVCSRQGSRAEVLFGAGTNVSAADIIAARAS